MRSLRQVSYSILLFVCLAADTLAQERLPSSAFDIVSIKPTPKDQLYKLKRECVNDRFVARGFPLSFLITWSFGLPDAQVLGLPEWTKSWDLAYDLDARAIQPFSEKECKAMVTSLLRERFHMVTRREIRNVKAYALVVSDKGSKLREVAPNEPNSAGVQLNGGRQSDLKGATPGWSMTRLAAVLSDIAEVGRPVVDQTGLPDTYSFKLTFSRRADDGLPSIFTSIQNELGLSLKPVTIPLDVLVVEQIEKATAN